MSRDSDTGNRGRGSARDRGAAPRASSPSTARGRNATAPDTAAPARHRLLGAVLVLAAASLWATFGLFARRLYEVGYTPLELASVRAVIGFVAIALVALPQMRRGGRVRVPLRALPLLAAYGIPGFALFGLLFASALEHTTVAIAVALLYTAPAFVLLMSAVIWREHVDTARGVALVMVLAGVLLVTGAAGSLLRGTAALSPTALWLGLGSGFGYALYTMFSKVASGRHGALASLFWSFAFASLALVLVESPVEPLLRSPAHLPWLIALGIVPTVLPYAFYLAALRELRASTASMLASVEPAVAALLAALILGETMGAAQFGGVALVVGAAVLLAREPAPATRPAPAPPADPHLPQ